ncbi:MAG: (d)CMP kinase [Spirochaetes bacterium]|nr:MAG: (d)CMP kinase [Spirochaetota bacterium]
MEGRRLVVAVDGPAGSGKSSVCRDAARRLHLHYIDSGALYRAITWYLLRNRDSLRTGVDYAGEIKNLVIAQRFNDDGTVSTFVNGDDVSGPIRSEMIAKNIGVVSDDPGIRGFVNALLRSWAGSASIIMDGRDIGTVVFPDADVKIFLDATAEVRSLRRVREYQGQGKTVDAEAIRKQIIQRDLEDTSRPFGRLVRADDAHYLETSSMNRDEVVEYLVDYISGRAR